MIRLWEYMSRDTTFPILPHPYKVLLSIAGYATPNVGEHRPIPFCLICGWQDDGRPLWLYQGDKTSVGSDLTLGELRALLDVDGGLMRASCQRRSCSTSATLDPAGSHSTAILTLTYDADIDLFTLHRGRIGPILTMSPIMLEEFRFGLHGLLDSHPQLLLKQFGFPL